MSEWFNDSKNKRTQTSRVIQTAKSVNIRKIEYQHSANQIQGPELATVAMGQSFTPLLQLSVSSPALDDVIMSVNMVLTSCKNCSLFSQTLFLVTRRLGFLVNALSCHVPSEGSSQHGRSPVSCFIFSDINEANAPLSLLYHSTCHPLFQPNILYWETPSFTC